jgi:hypothetical protein
MSQGCGATPTAVVDSRPDTLPRRSEDGSRDVPRIASLNYRGNVTARRHWAVLKVVHGEVLGGPNYGRPHSLHRLSYLLIHSSVANQVVSMTKGQQEYVVRSDDMSFTIIQ